MRSLAMIAGTIAGSALYEVYVNGSAEWLLYVAGGYLAALGLIAAGGVMRRLKLCETAQDNIQNQQRQWRRFFLRPHLTNGRKLWR